MTEQANSDGADFLDSLTDDQQAAPDPAAVAVSETPPVSSEPTATTTPIDEGDLLDKLLARVGVSYKGSADEWSLLLNIDRSLVSNATARVPGKQSVLSASSVFRSYGYNSGDVVEWIRKNNIAWSNTPILDALFDATASEAISPTANYSGSQVECLFGIDAKVMEAACKRGDVLRADGSAIGSTHRLPGEDLIRWIETRAVTINWPISKCSEIALKRRVNAEFEAEQANRTEPPRDTADRAFDLIERYRREEAAEEERNNQRSYSLYKTILLRRHNPAEQDDRDLAEICEWFKWDRERVREDIAMLDKAVELRALMERLPELDLELETAGIDNVERIARHKREEKAAEARLREASRMMTESYNVAPRKLDEMHRQRPYLFDPAPKSGLTRHQIRAKQAAEAAKAKAASPAATQAADQTDTVDKHKPRRLGGGVSVAGFPSAM